MCPALDIESGVVFIRLSDRLDETYEVFIQRGLLPGLALLGFFCGHLTGTCLLVSFCFESY